MHAPTPTYREHGDIINVLSILKKENEPKIIGRWRRNRRERGFFLFLFLMTDMKGCVIKVDNKVNETINCVDGLMFKLTLNLPALEDRARLIAPR
jgi:hypothetical protein